MVEALPSGKDASSLNIDSMVRERRQNTLFAIDDKSVHIITHEEFKPASYDHTDSPIYKCMNYLKFDTCGINIQVMDNSRVLCVGLEDKIELFNIADDPLHPKSIASS